MDSTEFTLEEYADMLAEVSCKVIAVKDSEIFIDITYSPLDDPGTYFWYSWSVTTGERYERD